METIKGSLSKIKILKMSQSPLVRFILDRVNCLITRHSFNFLYKGQEGSDLVVYGVHNSRNQFVVSKFCVMVKSYA